MDDLYYMHFECEREKFRSQIFGKSFIFVSYKNRDNTEAFHLFVITTNKRWIHNEYGTTYQFQWSTTY